MLTDKDLWFPNYIWSGTLKNINNEEIKRYCEEKIKETYLQPKDWFKSFIKLEECVDVAKLVGIIDQCVATAADECGIKPLQLHNIWVNQHPPGVAGPVHTHAGDDRASSAIFSGVYYLDADPTIDQGNIEFERRSGEEHAIPLNMIKELTPYTRSIVQYDSATNDLYIFSSWIPHGVTRNNSDKDRFSISFNYGE
jgi:uncharacterized protein (TIGR02466 family)|tara:strand:+ start:61 stop:648 length:588 start_codon:yes stop_codon:yes gene_type:complete